MFSASYLRNHQARCPPEAAMEKIMPRRHHRRPDLKVSIGERTCVLQTVAPAPRRMLPPLQKSAQEVVAVLLASTGLALAARRDAQVELLPGTPVTILISTGGQARAALVLPVSWAEASKLVGRPAPDRRDSRFEVLWEEDRLACLLPPDAELDQRREDWESGYAC